MAKAPKFKPHYNRVLGDAQNPTGKYFHDAKSYYGELKQRGLEPYDASAKDSGKRTPIKANAELRQVTQAIHDQTKGGKFRPSDKLLKKMESMGVNLKPTMKDFKHMPNQHKQGGFSS